MLLKIINSTLKTYCLAMTKIRNMSIIFAAVGLKLTCGAILLSWFWPERAFIFLTELVKYGMLLPHPWTICLSSFKAVLYGYYKQDLVASNIPDHPRSFKSICSTLNAAHSLGRNITCCFYIFWWTVSWARSNWRSLLRCPPCSALNIFKLFFTVTYLIVWRS